MNTSVKASNTILIIEDNEDDFEVTDRALRKAGLHNQILRCEDGQDAIDYVNREGAYADTTAYPLPGIILLDLNMPGITGHHVLEEIRASEQWRGIPVVVLTTSDDPKDISGCYDSGANSYIRKPVNIQKFFEAMSILKSYWFEVTLLPKKDEMRA